MVGFVALKVIYTHKHIQIHTHTHKHTSTHPLSLSLQVSSGRVYIYMGKREFVSIDGVIEPIKGVVHIQVLSVCLTANTIWFCRTTRTP